MHNEKEGGREDGCSVSVVWGGVMAGPGNVE